MQSPLKKPEKEKPEDTSFNAFAFVQNAIVVTLTLMCCFRAGKFYAAGSNVEAYAHSFMAGVHVAYLIYRVKRDKY